MPPRKRKQPIEDQDREDDILVERKKSTAPSRSKRNTNNNKEGKNGRGEKQDEVQQDIQQQHSSSTTRRRTRQSDPLLAPSAERESEPVPEPNTQPEPKPAVSRKKAKTVKQPEPDPSSAENTPRRSARKPILTAKLLDTDDELTKASKPQALKRARKQALTDTPEQQDKTNVNKNTHTKEQGPMPGPSPSQVVNRPKRIRAASKTAHGQGNEHYDKFVVESARKNNSRAATRKANKSTVEKGKEKAKGTEEQAQQTSNVTTSAISMINGLHDSSTSGSSANSLLDHLDDYVKLDLEVRYDNLQALYYELLEQTATDETNLNKAFASYKAMTEEKYQALEKVAKAQEKMVKKILRERDELKGTEETVAKLQEKVNAQLETIAAAQTENRSLKEKLSSIHKAAGNNNVAEATMKEDLLIDMSGLYIRDMKSADDGTTYDIIHTGGKDLTFHYRLFVPAYTSESELIDFVPLIDEARDAELISKLPDYLSEEISFQRKSLPQFYQKICRAMYS